MKPPARLPVQTGTNPGRSRNHNRRLVLELLRRHGPTGRKALSDMARLSTQAVANIIEDLVAEGMLHDLGRRRQGRGLPPIQYAINPAGGIAIGIEVAVGGLNVLSLDLAGNPLDEASIALDDLHPDPVFAAICGAVAGIRTTRQTPLVGVGLVMPGPFGIDGLSGVGPTTLPGETGAGLAERLSQELGVPVDADNDANAAAIAELLFGSGRNLSHFGLVYFGGGLGFGAVIRDQPLRGAFGNAGEIGHVVVAPGGRACPCGQSGCLERYASIQSLSEKMNLPAATLTPARIAALHDAGDPLLFGWMDEAALHLSGILGLMENVLDPQTVFLGGKLPPAVLDAVIARLRLPPSVASRADRRIPRAQRGLGGALSAARGAAALPLFNAFAPQTDPARDWTGTDRP